MYLSTQELTTNYYGKASQMDEKDVRTYLSRANAFAYGEIGGKLPEKHIDENLKAAVTLAFEIFSKAETGQVDPETGVITESAQAGQFARYDRRHYDPLDSVKSMLKPYADIYKNLTTKVARKVRFL